MPYVLILGDSTAVDWDVSHERMGFRARPLAQKPPVDLGALRAEFRGVVEATRTRRSSRPNPSS